MRPILFFLSVSLMTSSLHAQDKVPYRDKVFERVEITKNIFYKANTDNKRFTMDLYSPADDDRKGRPVIIWMHGGGFKFGNKSSRGIPIWCKQFSQKGYVCVAMNYSLSKEKTLSDPEAFIRGCQTAVHDLIALLQFLKAKQDEYGIDISKLILAGNSAGGSMALQAAYGIPNGFLDTNDSKTKPEEILPVKAVVNYWGAIVDTSWLAKVKIPIYSAVGEHDRVLSPTTKNGFLYGSVSIHKTADRESIPNQLKIYKNMGHEIQRHFIPFIAGPAVHKRWKELGEATSEFLFNQLFSS